MKKRLLACILSVAMAATLLIGCGSKEAETTEEEAAVEEAVEEAAEEAADNYKVAIILPGLISDAGWNSGGYNAVEYLNDVDGMEATYVENIGATDCEATMRDFADQGYNMIVCWSFDYGDYAMTVAPDYKDVIFVWAQGYMQDENLCTINAPLQETAYLMGMLAAKMSKTGVIGYIGGVDTVPMINALEGYKDGAKAANPDIKVIHSFAGTWSDVELGYQTAVAQFEQGVDVLMGRGDGIAQGCLQACIDNNVYCFGDVDDQNELAPDLLLTSSGWNVGLELEMIINQVLDGTFESQDFAYGMADGVTDITDFHGLVPDDIAEEIYAERDKIISGELVIEAKNEISE